MSLLPAQNRVCLVRSTFSFSLLFKQSWSTAKGSSKRKMVFIVAPTDEVEEEATGNAKQTTATDDMESISNNSNNSGGRRGRKQQKHRDGDVIAAK